MVVGVAHFPEDPAVPIGFKGGAAFPRLAADEPVGFFYRLAVIKKSSSICKVTIVTRRIRHLPGVNDGAVEIDQVYFASAGLRRKQCKAGEGLLAVPGPQAKAGALEFDLFDSHAFTLFRF